MPPPFYARNHFGFWGSDQQFDVTAITNAWFVFSLIAGTVVTAVGVGVVGGAVTDYNLNFRRSVPHGYGALAAVHLTIGLYNLVAATIGLIRPERPPPVMVVPNAMGVSLVGTL